MLKPNRFKCWQRKLKLDRLKTQRPRVKVKGLSLDKSKALIKIARDRECIWNTPGVVDREQERMDDFLE